MQNLPTYQCRQAWQIVQIRAEIAALAACFPTNEDIQDIANEAIPCRLTLEALLDIYFREVNETLCFLGAGGAASCIRPDPSCDFFTVHLGDLVVNPGEAGNLNIYDPWAKGLLFDDLVQVFGDMFFTQTGTASPHGMPFLTFISAPLLTDVSGTIFTAYNHALLSVSFPLLETAGVDCVVGSSNNQTDIDVHSLRTVGRDLDVGGVLTTTIDLSALETVGRDAQLGATAIISVPNLTSVGGNLRFGQSAPTTTVDLTGLTALGGNLDATNAALDVASVNSILVTLDAITPALSGRTIRLDGGTSAAPTGAGATAKTNLQVLNTVMTN